jgi:hypothetical protein
VFIENPLANSMASFNPTVALEEGATFIFSSWICVGDSIDNFCQHLIDTGKPEAYALKPKPTMTSTTRRQASPLRPALDLFVSICNVFITFGRGVYTKPPPTLA